MISLWYTIVFLGLIVQCIISNQYFLNMEAMSIKNRLGKLLRCDYNPKENRLYILRKKKFSEMVNPYACPFHYKFHDHRWQLGTKGLELPRRSLEI